MWTLCVQTHRRYVDSLVDVLSDISRRNERTKENERMPIKCRFIGQSKQIRLGSDRESSREEEASQASEEGEVNPLDYESQEVGRKPW